MHTLLLVDDDVNFCRAVKDYFQDASLQVLGVGTGRECLAACAETRVDLVLLDQRLPDGEGAALCPRILAANPRCRIIFITAHPSVDNVVQGLRAGAHDYLSKPIDLDELKIRMERSLRTAELEVLEDLRNHQSRVEREATEVVGQSPALQEVRRLAQLAASSAASVLLTGETGTGKNVLARYIHYHGPHATAALVSVNAAAIPKDLLESELFGHERGAFTGATATRKGMFELADGGTLFLDEIGDLSLDLQAKLLGVLEEKRVRRVGGGRSIPVNVRVVAATNMQLETAVRAHAFREDLYYRLNVINIHVPPLRQRVEDIPLLCNHFLVEMAGRRSVEIPAGELAVLQAYDWPGNIRELRNVLERTLTLQQGSVVFPSVHLHVEQPMALSLMDPPYDPEQEPTQTLAHVEQHHILAVFKKWDGNHVKAAQALGISESTLRRKLRGYRTTTVDDLITELSPPPPETPGTWVEPR